MVGPGGRDLLETECTPDVFALMISCVACIR